MKMKDFDWEVMCDDDTCVACFNKKKYTRYEALKKGEEELAKIWVESGKYRLCSSYVMWRKSICPDGVERVGWWSPMVKGYPFTKHVKSPFIPVWMVEEVEEDEYSKIKSRDTQSR